MPSGVYERTKEARQSTSEGQKIYLANMTKEERLVRLKSWIEAGLVNLEKGRRIAKEKVANMTKEERRERATPWALAGQANPSSIEKKIWNELDKLNIEYKTQVPFARGRFIVDICLLSMKIVIECNGTFWHNYKIFPEKKIRDDAVEKCANKKGYKVM